jgi:CBS domain-containing protein
MITVQECLSRKPAAVLALRSTDTVHAALALMRERKVRSVLITEDGRLEGIVSQGDCAMKVLFHGLDAHKVLLDAIMTRKPLTVGLKDAIDHCMKVMAERRIRHLPVVSEDNTVLGMVSVGDVVKEIIRQQEQHIRYLETYIKGHTLEY